MNVGYVVLYVNNAEACRSFWIEQIGMVEKRRTEAGGYTIAQVGFADQKFAFELVPLELMKDNPDNLDLATPSIGFRVDDLRPRMPTCSAGVRATDVGEHSGTPSFAFSDPEGHWFAVTHVMAMSSTATRRMYTMTLASVYPLYLAKVEKKGRTKDELDVTICWLTGYDESQLRRTSPKGRRSRLLRRRPTERKRRARHGRDLRRPRGADRGPRRATDSVPRQARG
jgi:catechol 2,3-dioxygenase-like lactoylglutathione lyase family enzyme